MVRRNCLTMLAAHVYRLAGCQLAGKVKISECHGKVHLQRDWEVSTVLSNRTACSLLTDKPNEQGIPIPATSHGAPNDSLKRLQQPKGEDRNLTCYTNISKVHMGSDMHTCSEEESDGHVTMGFILLIKTHVFSDTLWLCWKVLACIPTSTRRYPGDSQFPCQ